jgi:hypothetical protein
MEEFTIAFIEEMVDYKIEQNIKLADAYGGRH